MPRKTSISDLFEDSSDITTHSIFIFMVTVMCLAFTTVSINWQHKHIHDYFTETSDRMRMFYIGSDTEWLRHGRPLKRHMKRILA